jgi:hypothetical protein
MLDWLEQARTRLESEFGDVGDLGLSPGDVELLLELARAAAHESGDRTNAPVAAYLVGLVHGRRPDTPLADVVFAALRTAERGPGGEAAPGD